MGSRLMNDAAHKCVNAEVRPAVQRTGEVSSGGNSAQVQVNFQLAILQEVFLC